MSFKASVLLTFSIGGTLFAQTHEEREIIKEGRRLYQSEMASWHGTDIFQERFKDKQQNAGGYFSYTDKNRAICIFFSNDKVPKVIASFSFDGSYNADAAIVDSQEREMTKHELDLFEIREDVLSKLFTDKYFEFYKDMNPNVIPIVDDKGKRVYVLTASTKPGVVVFGNDYLLTFTKNNELKESKRLHKNIITLEYKEDMSGAQWTAHTHSNETGELITATDICTLMLYEKYANWGQHFVMSDKKVSIWDCKRDELVVMTREAWDRISERPKEK